MESASKDIPEGSSQKNGPVQTSAVRLVFHYARSDRFFNPTLIILWKINDLDSGLFGVSVR